MSALGSAPAYGMTASFSSDRPKKPAGIGEPKAAFETLTTAASAGTDLGLGAAGVVAGAIARSVVASAATGARRCRAR